jgi:hypothetical protein
MTNERSPENTNTAIIRDAQRGAYWDFKTLGGVSFLAYALATILVMAAMIIGGMASYGIEGRSLGSSKYIDPIKLLGDFNGVGSLALAAIYLLPPIVPIIISVFALVTSKSGRGRAWTIIALLLSVAANPTFVALGILSNSTWKGF